jgi:type I restriction enzyme M protein
MLNQETKRKIDSCRDMLVGKLPDPKAQIEQITYALIYKFMGDMDKASVEMGGKASFFVNGYEQYAWDRLMSQKLGGTERLALYSEAIGKLSLNPHLPQLFRDIFKDAFLPYRDPETLNMFLKKIDWFTYSHSEDLGDAFEYLLSVMGSQGDAGQFRTPRHIIDFIVEVIDPQKDETILDPACGTAGFLISSYKHILKQNTGEKPGDKLTPDERTTLMNQMVGYDISPDMARLSLVNMYLHGFQGPHIYEYDTLTDEARWDDTFDIIMANPPFMSPKGGIRPHKRFSIQANRSEVLFVDYIAEHLTANGRAGVIVPEGIIFQSGNAYKSLRKMLVENYLFCVVSLPSGVFNPYSGVKTSILLMDKTLAKQTDKILFVKIENDGFDLGAQRREIPGSDFPQALVNIKTYLQSARNGKEFCLPDTPNFLFVSKQQLAENGDYNLSLERYRTQELRQTKWPLVELGEVCTDILSGGTPSTEVEWYWNGNIPWMTSADIVDNNTIVIRKNITKEGLDNSATNLIPKDNIIVVTRVGLGKVVMNKIDVCISQDSQGLILNKEKVFPKFLLYLLVEKVLAFKSTSQGTTIQGVTKNQLKTIQVPLPPLYIQHEIASEIEAYQKIIDGARQVVDNYKPKIKIDPEWPMVRLEEVCEINPKKSIITNLSEDLLVSFVPMADLSQNEMNFIPTQIKILKDVVGSYTYFQNNDVLIARVTPCFENGKAGLASNLENGIGFGSSEYTVLRAKEITLPQWIYFNIANEVFRKFAKAKMTGTGGLQRVPKEVFADYQIPIPSLYVQQGIVVQIEKEQQLVSANKHLIQIYERKIKSKIAEVWET